MASAFAHAITAVALGKAFTLKDLNWKFWLLGICCAILPDADAIGFKLGIPYDSFWGHRGFTHSLVFAVMLGLFIVMVFYRDTKLFSLRWWGFTAYFTLAAASHAILDAMTTGGKGVAFFSPFDNTRYFLPWRVIKVSPISIEQFFSEWGVKVLLSELVWVFLPCLLFIGIISLLRRKQ